MLIRGNTQGLLLVVCGLLAGPCLEYAAANDWLRTRVRAEQVPSSSTPTMLSRFFHDWGGESDLIVIGSLASAAESEARATRRSREPRVTLVSARAFEFDGLQDMFDRDAPAARRFDDSSTSQRDLTARSDQGAEHEEPGPIEEPGPDSADFPDSAFTVKPGVVYFETSLTTESSKGPRVRDYFTNTLIRVGLVEDWELRISSPGVIQEVGPGVDKTGFGPLTFGFKHHVWDEDKDGWLPAMGIIAQVTTPTASAGFDDGAATPTIFFNFDKGLPMEFDFEVNTGMTWAKDDSGDRFLQGNILWALGHEIAPHVEAFTHGFANFPVADGRGAEVVVGPGIAWINSPRSMLDFSLNFGLTPDSPHRLTRFGLSLAF